MAAATSASGGLLGNEKRVCDVHAAGIRAALQPRIRI